MLGDFPSGKRRFWAMMIFIAVIGIGGLLLMWAFHV